MSRTPNTLSRSRGGFTMLELLIVISIIAILALLATGAAMKSLKGSRHRRADATARALELALQNYRATENEWPFAISDFDPPNNSRDPIRYWLHGKNNNKAFKKLFHGRAGQSKTAYLEASSLLTISQGKRITLKAALELGRTDMAIGYPLPDNVNRFCFYCICYNPLTDTVKVYRQDRSHERGNGGSFGCPENY